ECSAGGAAGGFGPSGAGVVLPGGGVSRGCVVSGAGSLGCDADSQSENVSFSTTSSSKSGADARAPRAAVSPGDSPASILLPHCGQKRADARTDAPHPRHRREISGKDMGSRER
ncbi:MAG TPA: hypothetical protein VEQ42_08325, partial [Pyrinomonadaceae bacterium]|nr:hypothetical protein [Pyrinomonadaceae bacterium]